MNHHTRTAALFLLLGSAAAACRTGEIVGAGRAGPHDQEPALLSEMLLEYTPPIVSSFVTAPLRTSGWSSGETMFTPTDDNYALLQQMIAKGVQPEVIHKMQLHVKRTAGVSTSCGTSHSNTITHISWCDYTIANQNNEPYTVSASTEHQFRHTLQGMLTRASVSEERHYKPKSVDTVTRKDSVLDPTGPTDGPSRDGDSGGSQYTICWEYYELDLVTGQITFLFTTCPPSTQVRSDVTAGASTGELVGLTALLVEVPALPRGARIMVRRTGDEQHPFVIQGVASATDSDWAGGIEMVRAIVNRVGVAGPPAVYSLGRSTGTARAEARAQAAGLRKRMQAATPRAVPGMARQRAVPLAMFIER